MGTVIHCRYVGAEAARGIHQNGWTLEEYREKSGGRGGRFPARELSEGGGVPRPVSDCPIKP